MCVGVMLVGVEVVMDGRVGKDNKMSGERVETCGAIPIGERGKHQRAESGGVQ